uniref:DB domain-containing protein n=1 Tax=Steinernema glaseri TaxID=37863 RepID=A0A1I7YJ66_9BILA
MNTRNWKSLRQPFALESWRRFCRRSAPLLKFPFTLWLASRNRIISLPQRTFRVLCVKNVAGKTVRCGPLGTNFVVTATVGSVTISATPDSKPWDGAIPWMMNRLRNFFERMLHNIDGMIFDLPWKVAVVAMVLLWIFPDAIDARHRRHKPILCDHLTEEMKKICKPKDEFFSCFTHFGFEPDGLLKDAKKTCCGNHERRCTREFLETFCCHGEICEQKCSRLPDGKYTPEFLRILRTVEQSPGTRV